MATAESDVKNESAELDTATTESSTIETTSPTDGEINTDLEFSEEDMGDQPEGESKDDTEEEGNQETDTDTDENGDEPAKGAEKRKQQLNTEIRDKVAQRNALKAEIAELNQQKYQLRSNEDIPTVDSLLEQVNPETGDYYTRLEAELTQIRAERELEKQQKQMDDYTNQIVENNIRLIDESERVLKDFPMFDPQSDQYDEALAQAADKLLDESIIRDQTTGRVIGSQISPYELYSTIAAAAGSAKVKGEVAGRKAAQRMMNSADVVGSQPAKTKDSDDDPFVKALTS